MNAGIIRLDSIQQRMETLRETAAHPKFKSPNPQVMTVSGELITPNSIPWVYAIVVLEGLNNDSESMQTLFQGMSSFSLEAESAGEYHLFAQIVTMDGTSAMVHFNHRLQGSCQYFDTLIVNQNLTGINLSFENSGALNIAWSYEELDNYYAAFLLQQTSENCDSWALNPVNSDSNYYSLIGMEPGEYILTAYILDDYYLMVDTAIYPSHIIISANQTTTINWTVSSSQEIFYIQSPTVSALTSDQTAIEWKLSSPAICSLFYSQIGYDSIAWTGNSQEAKTDFRAQLGPLIPDRVYVYSIHVSNPEHQEIPELRRYGFFTTLTPSIYVTKGPTASFVTDRSAFLQWKTNKTCICSLYYADEYASTEWNVLAVNTSNPDSTFHIQLTGLNPSQAYYYKVKLFDSYHLFISETYTNSFSTLFEFIPKEFQLLRPPEIIYLNDHSVMIDYETDAPLIGICNVYQSSITEHEPIYYGIEQQYHLFYFDDLLPGTTYKYRVGTLNATRQPVYYGPVYHFTTFEIIDTIPPLIINRPVISTITNKALLTFETDEAANGVIHLYKTGFLADTYSWSDFIRDHQIYFSNLDENTAYTYEIELTDRAGNSGTWQGEKSLLEKILPSRQFLSIGNSFTTSTVADTNAPRFSEFPNLVAVYDSLAAIKFVTSEQTQVSIRGYNENRQLMLWWESDVYSQEHTIFLPRLIPGAQYDLAITVSDIANNQDSTSGSLQFTTYMQNPPTNVKLREAFQPFFTDNFAAIFFTTNASCYAQALVERSQQFSNPFYFNHNKYSDEHLLIFNNISNGTQYYYQLTGLDCFNQTMFESNIDSITLGSGIQNEPLEFIVPPAVTWVSNSTAIIDWSVNILATASCAYYPRNSTEDSVFVSNQSYAKAQRIALTCLTPETDYGLIVYATDFLNHTQQTTLEFTTQAMDFIDIVPPQAPSNLIAAIDSNQQVVLRWNASPAPDLRGYILYRITAGTYQELASNYMFLEYSVGLYDPTAIYAIAAMDFSHNISDTLTAQIIGIGDDNQRTSETLILDSNFPNPFDKVTHIRFYSPNSGQIKIDIYNVLGKKIYGEVCWVPAKQLTTIRLDTYEWPAGIYFYRITAPDSKSYRGRMLHLK